MRILLISALAVCVAVLPGCRFKVPTMAEQDELVARGTFPGQLPPWMAGQKGTHTQSLSAVVPSGFSAPSHSASASGAISAEADPRDALANAEKESDAKRKGSDADERVEDKSEAGALARVIAVCPEIEDEVTQALTTTNPNDRLQLYQQLTQRCPESADIWFWLGKDYLAEGRLIDARNSLQKAVIRDGSLEHARSLFEAVNEQLNKR